MEAKCFYPDIVEIGNLSDGYYGYDADGNYVRKPFVDRIVELESRLGTEFSFYVVPNSWDGTYMDASRAGYKRIGQKLNWYPMAHDGDHLISIWFKRLRDGGTMPTVPRETYKTRTRAAHAPEHLAWSSCGVKFLDGLPRLRRGNKMLSLARLPVELSPRWLDWLAAHDWRHVVTGKLASYWVNGWESSTYPGEASERASYQTF